MAPETRHYVSPPRILLGSGVQEQIGRLATELGARQVLLVSDAFLRSAGAAAHVADLLARENIGCLIYDVVATDPTVADIDRCAQAARDGDCNAVIGLGGGSTLDIAKGAALITAVPGWRFEELLRNGPPPQRLPKILMPSTSGSGSEVSQAIVVMNNSGDHKIGLHAPWVGADVAVIDPDIAESMPPSVTADTGLDALTHGLEALLARNASPPSEALAWQACSLIWRALPRAYAHGGDQGARHDMCTGAMLAGMAFTWSGLGAVHALAYPLAVHHGLSHGRSNAVVLPHVLRHTFATVPGSSAAVIRALGLVDHASDRSTDETENNRLADTLAAYVEDLGISVRLRDVGVDRNEFAGMAAEAIRANQRLIASNPCPLIESDAVGIYKEAW